MKKYLLYRSLPVPAGRWILIFRAMRITIFLTLVCVVNVYATGYSQDKLTLSLKNVKLSKVFHVIQQDTHYQFLYNDEEIEQAPPVSVVVKDATVPQILAICFTENYPLEYRIKDSTVVVSPRRKAPRNIKIPDEVMGNANRTPGIVLPQKEQITGLVTDSSGAALPGVTIYVKDDQSIGTTTDLNGRYVIEVPVNATIVFSMLGFVQQEVTVKGKTQINITLLQSSQMLGGTVITAFGEQKKKEDVVGAVSSISPGDLRIPSSNLTASLAGRVAGMIAFQRSGEPGANNANFFIRGVTTFGYKKSPLILIDGIESTTDDLARLEVDDIESFSILKDATATALYGSRAANGVILIKTKEGKEDKAEISFRLENTVSMPTREIKLADPITFMELNNEAIKTRNPDGVLFFSQEQIDKTKLGLNPYRYPAVDWKKTLLKNYTMNQRANLNVRGGGKVARYYVSGSMNIDNGLLKRIHDRNYNNNIKLISYSIRSNVNVNLSKTTSLAIKLGGIFDDYTGPTVSGARVYQDVVNTPPTLFPPYFPKDSSNAYIHHTLYGNYDDGSGDLFYNPYAELTSGFKAYSRSTINAQLRLQQDMSFLARGLNVKLLLNVKRYAYSSNIRKSTPFYYQAVDYDPKTGNLQLVPLNENSGTEYLSYQPGRKDVQSSFYTELTLNYDHEFNSGHNLSGLLIFTAENRRISNAGNLYASLPQRNEGVAGRATYSYKHRYYLEFNFGLNGSERFSKQHRWGFFPSLGASWNVSNEAFFDPLKSVITNLKFRATYGLTGNDAIGSPDHRFFYLSNIDMNGGQNVSFGSENGYTRTGIAIQNYANPDITWERGVKANLGLNMELFGKAEMVLDVYKQVRSQILMTRSDIPYWIGLVSTPSANVGKAEGHGVDLTLKYKQAFPGGLWLSGRLNFTYAANKYLIYEEPSYVDAPWKSKIGYSIGERWGYIADRLFVDDEETVKSPKQEFGKYGGGDIKYRDINKDGQITTLDQVPLGYPVTPEIVYGFGLSMGYKQFDFSFFFQGLGRESFFISPTNFAPFIKTNGNNERQIIQKIADDHWSENNRNLYAFWPRLTANTSIGYSNDFQRSTWWLRNGAFIRLKEVELGYTLPEKTAHKLAMRSLRVYVNSMNPLCFSVFKLWDVEQGGNALNYPIQKMFNLGVLVRF